MLRARLDASVLQEEGGDGAPFDDLGQVCVNLARERAWAATDWQPFEVSLGGAVGTLEERTLVLCARIAGMRAVALALGLVVVRAHAVAVRVVRELVVVPHGDHRRARAKLHQAWVLDIQRVAAAVV